ncbi:MAG: helix-turn-helix domain-containing protein [Lachnospiraceae bacterium]|nr:helix-turn-helix domain-containing protein [Lachnospiraceae bacterium]MDD3615651.1 helix-turn-helix domain-containing protein [Lachnospiraceae bacterium]
MFIVNLIKFAVVDKTAETQVDVVLTDICMPHVDGMELSKYLYENYPDTQIIIFSGFSDFEYAKKAIQYKVSEYLLKPVTAKELSEVLTRMREKLDKKYQDFCQQRELTQTYHNYRKNEKVIISKALSQLVMGTQEITKSLDEIRELGVELSASDYRVAVLDIDLYSEIYHVDEEQKKESALMAFVLANISEEIVNESGNGICYQDSENRVYLLMQTNKPKEFVATSLEISRKIQRTVQETMKLTVSIGLGCYVKNLEDLYLSYQSAKKAIQLRYLFGNETLIDMETEKVKMDMEADFSTALRNLEEAVKNQDKKTIHSNMSDIFEKIRNCYISKNRACLYLQQVVREIYDNVTQILGDTCLIDNARKKVVDEIAESLQFQDACEHVEEYCVFLAGQMESISQSSSMRQAMKAMEYIRENYDKPDLSLNNICAYLAISTSHFSTIFKEATGETFMEVLIRIRMEKAKELLEQTNLKNYEIAERVGFSDPHYFSMSFKKMTGCTPTEYAREKRG